MSESQTGIEGWAIVELFGHNTIAGYVATTMLGTSGMLWVDVPAMDEAPGYTRFYGLQAIYSLTLVSEDIARLALKEIRPRAVTVYIPRQLPAPQPSDYTSYEEEGDDEDRNEERVAS